jgi:hypothetical protein
VENLVLLHELGLLLLLGGHELIVERGGHSQAGPVTDAHATAATWHALHHHCRGQEVPQRTRMS